MLPHTLPEAEDLITTFYQVHGAAVSWGQRTDHTLKLRSSLQQTPLINRREKTIRQSAGYVPHGIKEGAE